MRQDSVRQQPDKRTMTKRAGICFRAVGIVCVLSAVCLLMLPVRAFAADGARLTGYAPLYLPEIVSITVQASPSSFGTASGGGTGILPGENVTVTAKANEGYYFIGWLEDNRLVSENATYTFRAERDRLLIANFGDVVNSGSGVSAGGGSSAGAAGEASSGSGNAATNSSADTASSGGGASTNTTGGTGTSANNATTASNAASSAQAQAPSPYAPVNYNDMPTTGIADYYRVPVIIMLLLFGVIAVLISLPAGRRKKR